MMRQGKIERIFVHHSASDFDTTFDDIKRWHVEKNKWDDIGYHYVILGNGTVTVGRSTAFVPAAQGGSNVNTVAICVVGNGAHRMDQLSALKALLKELLAANHLGTKDIWVHNEVCDTICPGYTKEQLLYVLFGGGA